MAAITMLEAIRQAIFEEMERDPGRRRPRRRHWRLRRRVQSHRRPARALRSRARDRHAHQRNGHRRRGLRHELSRPAPDRRNAVHRFHRLLLQSGHELRRQVALPLGRARADGIARAFRRRRARRPVSFRESGNVFRAHAGAENDLSLHRVRREGPAEIRDARQQSRALLRAQISLPPHQGRNARGGLHGADRQSRGAPRRPRSDDRELRGDGAYVAWKPPKRWRKKASTPK